MGTYQLELQCRTSPSSLTPGPPTCGSPLQSAILLIEHAVSGDVKMYRTVDIKAKFRDITVILVTIYISVFSPYVVVP